MGKKVYVRSGGQWVEITTGAGVTTSASAPASPLTGQIYFNTTEQRMYVYNGTTWVDVAGDDFLAYQYFD
jgi:hypothetical protein